MYVGMKVEPPQSRVVHIMYKCMYMYNTCHTLMYIFNLGSYGEYVASIYKTTEPACTLVVHIRIQYTHPYMYTTFYTHAMNTQFILAHLQILAILHVLKFYFT